MVIHTPQGRREEPLLPDRMVEVEGVLGTTRIELEGGTVRVTHSPCPLKLCVRAGRMCQPGKIIVCAPNRVAVQLEGSEGFDAIAH